MELDILFRPMKRVDVPVVAQMEKICFRSPWTERMLASEVKNPLAHYHVMEYEDALIAYAGMWILFDEAHITNVAVLPEFRRRGLGRRIMLSSMQVADRLGATRMTLEVRETNLGAQALYAQLGFQEAGRRKRYYSDTGEAALIMWNNSIQKTLTAFETDI